MQTNGLRHFIIKNYRQIRSPKCSKTLTPDPNEGEGVSMRIWEREGIRKGFTLAEILIVIGIIAVLAAVSLPIFTRNLEKSREAYDVITMRQAASAAIDIFYVGITDATSAASVGLRWWDNAGTDSDNAAGVYDPKTSKFLPYKSDQSPIKPYGRGTARDGGTTFTMGNSRGAYAPKEDYTKALIMVSIYPFGDNKHVEVYWKNATGSNHGKYVGGQNGNNGNDPKYSIRVTVQ